MALLPTDRVGELWEAIEFTPDDQQLPTVGGLVEADVLDVATVVEASDGQFRVQATSGDYLACVLDGTGPYTLRGCAPATVDGPATWEISRGEGGVSLSTS